jgi:hypothetical protein
MAAIVPLMVREREGVPAFSMAVPIPVGRPANRTSPASTVSATDGDTHGRIAVSGRNGRPATFPGGPLTADRSRFCCVIPGHSGGRADSAGARYPGASHVFPEPVLGPTLAGVIRGKVTGVPANSSQAAVLTLFCWRK